SGLAGTPAWTAESDQASANFGHSVASAGDVNGDGFSDLIVGASFYDNGQTDEGRAFVYYGNGTGGLSRIPHQYRSDATAPRSPLGRSDSQSSFRARQRTRSAGGRSLVRLEVEAKPLGTPFSGTGTVVSGTVDTGAPGAGGSYASITQPITGLTV